MPKRKSEEIEEESEYFDSYDYENEDEELGEEYSSEESLYDEYGEQPELDDMSIIDIVNEYGVDSLADTIIDSLSNSDLEKIRDRISEYLE